MSFRYASFFLIVITLSAYSNMYPHASMNPFGHAMMGPRAARATGFDRGPGADVSRYSRTSRPEISSFQALTSQVPSSDAAELAHIKASMHELSAKVDALFALTESAMNSIGRIEDSIDIKDKDSSAIIDEKIRTQLEMIEFLIKQLTNVYGNNLEQLNSADQINTFDVAVISLLKTIVVNCNRLLELKIKKD